ncbi:class I SAM-dependent methyltransferase [Kolteria novifilia]|uniref:class I SAM-dependent methyltransferase n=1 Tax=Kolteria novifilia TaxID=2527975 RepID=UPI003AF3F9E4
MIEHLRFLGTAIRDRYVGAVAPTPKGSVRAVCEPMDISRPVTVVEYGPGTGVFTRYLKRRLHPESTVLALELNEFFAETLTERLAKTASGAQVHVVNDDCRNVERWLEHYGLGGADYILSGIPFSFLDEPSRREIIARTASALTPEGLFLVYQYSFMVAPYLEERFELVRRSRRFLHVPPLCMMQGHKLVA